MTVLLNMNVGSWNSDDWALIGTIGTSIFILGGFFVWIKSIAKKTSKIDGIETKVIKIDSRLANGEKNHRSIEKLIEKLTIKIDRLLESGFSTSNSPRILNDRGKKILEDSKVMKIIDPKRAFILEQVKALAPKNAYQAEKAILAVVAALSEDPENTEHLEVGAFESGESIDTVLIVAALHIRDSILIDLGMNSIDIDLGDS